MDRCHRFRGSDALTTTLIPTASAPADAAQTARWARTEFGAAQLGDIRRTRRLVDLATTLAHAPAAAFPEACRDPAQCQALYDFLENDAIAPDALLAPHVHATTDRCADVPLILAVQDTTELQFTHHPHTKGLGPLHRGQRGLLVHTTLAVRPDHTPVGLLGQRVWARDPAQPASARPRRTRAIAEKESDKWRHGLAAAIALRAHCPTTTVVSVGDREADVYDLFVAARPLGVAVRVRAAQDRRRAEPAQAKLWTQTEAVAVLGRYDLALPTRGAQPARTAQLEVQARWVTLRPPKARTHEGLPMVRVLSIRVREPQPPTDVAGLDWLLLTTMDVPLTAAAVREVVGWYGARWVIEEWHRVLKSGCRIEDRRLQDGDHLRRALTVLSVIAWRLRWLTRQARTEPEQSCAPALSRAQWQAWWCLVHRQATPPPPPPTCPQAIRWLGQLGGHLPGKDRGEPGAMVVWRGFHHLQAAADLFAVLTPDTAPSIDKR